VVVGDGDDVIVVVVVVVGVKGKRREGVIRSYPSRATQLVYGCGGDGRWWWWWWSR
jgi:hypothetical protein